MSFSIRIGNYFDKANKDPVVQLMYNNVPIMGYYINGEVKFFKEYDNPDFDKIEGFSDTVNDLIKETESSLDYLKSDDSDDEKFNSCANSLLDMMNFYEAKLNKESEEGETC